MLILKRQIIIAAILAGFVLPLGAQPTPKPVRAERKELPQIQQFSYSRKIPFRKEGQTIISSVSFLYVYENVQTGATRNAYNEALNAVSEYLMGLASPQNITSSESAGARKNVKIHETTSGGMNSPRIYSIQAAMDAATRAKVFEVDIEYYVVETNMMPDGTKASKNKIVKTERQTFSISGDPKTAKIEIQAVNCDAIELAENLFPR